MYGAVHNRTRTCLGCLGTGTGKGSSAAPQLKDVRCARRCRDTSCGPCNASNRCPIARAPGVCCRDLAATAGSRRAPAAQIQLVVGCTTLTLLRLINARVLILCCGSKGQFRTSHVRVEPSATVRQVLPAMPARRDSVPPVLIPRYGSAATRVEPVAPARRLARGAGRTVPGALTLAWPSSRFSRSRSWMRALAVVGTLR